MNWDELFGVHVPLLELFVRGSCVYWFLFLAFRFVMRRDIGALGVADILLLVIVADAAQNAFAWNLFIDRMAFRFRWFERFARPKPVQLIRDGRLLTSNLAREHRPPASEAARTAKDVRRSPVRLARCLQLPRA